MVPIGDFPIKLEAVQDKCIPAATDIFYREWFLNLSHFIGQIDTVMQKWHGSISPGVNAPFSNWAHFLRSRFSYAIAEFLRDSQPRNVTESQTNTNDGDDGESENGSDSNGLPPLLDL